MTAPSLIQYADSFGANARTTSSVSWQAGDLIVAITGDELGSQAPGAPAATGLTFTAVTGALCGGGSGSYTYGNAYTASPSVSGTATVSSATAGGGSHQGLMVWVWRGRGGPG